MPTGASAAKTHAGASGGPTSLTRSSATPTSTKRIPGRLFSAHSRTCPLSEDPVSIQRASMRVPLLHHHALDEWADGEVRDPLRHRPVYQPHAAHGDVPEREPSHRVGRV